MGLIEIVSVVILLIIIVYLAVINIKSSVPVLISVLFTILLFSKPTYYGWYLMPLIYILPVYIGIILCSYEKRKKEHIIAIMVIVILNALYLHNDISYNIESKLAQIDVINSQQKYIQTIDDFFARNAEKYSPENAMYQTEFGMDRYGATIYDFNLLEKVRY